MELLFIQHSIESETRNKIYNSNWPQPSTWHFTDITFLAAISNHGDFFALTVVLLRIWTFRCKLVAFCHNSRYFATTFSWDLEISRRYLLGCYTRNQIYHFVLLSSKQLEALTAKYACASSWRQKQHPNSLSLSISSFSFFICNNKLQWKRWIVFVTILWARWLFVHLHNHGWLENKNYFSWSKKSTISRPISDWIWQKVIQNDVSQNGIFSDITEIMIPLSDSVVCSPSFCETSWLVWAVVESSMISSAISGFCEASQSECF